jgi:hypothetical protein
MFNIISVFKTVTSSKARGPVKADSFIGEFWRFMDSMNWLLTLASGKDVDGKQAGSKG